MKTLKILAAAICIVSFSACKKEGIGGKASVNGHVQHHGKAIPNAIVYIKYGATELPGTNASDYDNSTMASASDAHYEFEELRKGDYYLYATGYDSACVCTVEGGTSIQIKDKTGEVEAMIAVTEK